MDHDQKIALWLVTLTYTWMASVSVVGSVRLVANPGLTLLIHVIQLHRLYWPCQKLRHDICIHSYREHSGHYRGWSILHLVSVPQGE